MSLPHGKKQPNGYAHSIVKKLKTGKACRMPKEFAERFDVDI